MDIPIETMKRMRLRPNDIVIVTTEQVLTEEEVRHIKDILRKVIKKIGIPNVQVILLDAAFDIKIIGKEE